MNDSQIISIPNWISTRVYKALKGCTLAYAVNERTKELVVFEDLTARIWDLILAGANISEIYAFAKDNDADDEIEAFLSSIVDFIEPKSSSSTLSVGDNEPLTSKECFSEENFGEIKSYLNSTNKLSSITLELTYKCNLKCIHCYNDKDDFSSEISFEDAKKIIDEAYDMGVYNITLTGGEATLNKDFLKIAKYIRSKKLSLNIFTNTQSLYDDSELMKEVINLYPHSVCVSLYSMDPEVHDSITGIKGSFEKTMKVLDVLKKNNILTRINCFVMKNNFLGIDKVYSYAEENGFSAVIDVRFINNENRFNSEHQLTEEQLISFYSKYFDSENCFVENGVTEDFFEKRICSAGIKSAVVTSRLELIPCNPFKLVLGNLNNQSLKTIYSDKDETTPLNRWRNTRNKDVQGCFKEDYCYFCKYCPAVEYSNSLNLKKSETLCKMSKAKMLVNKRKQTNEIKQTKI